MRSVTLKDAMTAHPLFIDVSATLSDAQALMRKHFIHHLPVVAEKIVIGLLSMDDIHIAESIARFDPETASVQAAMESPPLVVPLTAGIAEVVGRMVDERRQAALVVDQESLVGIFTSNDAMRALSNMLAQRPRRSPPHPIPDY